MDTPVLGNLYLDGLLTANTSFPNLTLHAHNIWIQRGAIYAGTQDIPYPGNFSITLHGSKYDPDIIVDADVYTNNKVLVNTGALHLYG